MIHRLRFYLVYALRNIQRGGRWTMLAILCITAGVATVVALRSLGLAIGDTLINNMRVETKGDMLIRNDGWFSAFGSNDPDAFPPSRLNELLDWAEDAGARTTAFMSGRNMQLGKADQQGFGRPSFIGSFFIEPTSYPPTHTILALDPPDAPLGSLFSGGNDVVISENLAGQSGISVGDTVRVSGTQELYTVRGIVSTAEESSVSNFLNAFFGFAYFDLENAAQVINDDIAPNRIGLLFPQELDREAMERYILEVEEIAPNARINTTFDLLERYRDISQYLSDFVVVMGLGALLIGGVGIMNTMLVLVRRRTNEIASVKTFGLRARQIAILFLTEGLMLGLIGSFLGIVIGIGLSLVVNEYGSVALRQPLIWRVYPEALLFGFALGMVVTAIFSVAPVLTAVRVRPIIILRPNENHLVALGVLQTIALLVFVTVTLGLIVGHIVRPSLELLAARSAELEADVPADSRAGAFRGPRAPESESTNSDIESNDRRRRPDGIDGLSLPSPYAIGVMGVGGAFAVFALLIALLWLIVLLIGKLPSFGLVTLRLALRNMTTSRLRTATTLLALSAGMLALSSIAFVGEGTRELLNIQLSRSFGGNVLVFPFPGLPASMIEGSLENALSEINLQYQTTIANYESTVTAVESRAVDQDNDLQFSVWDSDKPDIYVGQGTIQSGRMLTLADRGQPIAVLPLGIADLLDVEVGDRITVDLDATALELEVVGLISSSGFFNDSDSGALLPPQVVPGAVKPAFKLYSYQVSNDELNRALTELSSVIFAFAIDVQFIDGLIGRLIDQFAAIPTVVALLSLFAAAVIMANTVALATLERRRQIGILKAIGLKSRRVLQIMLIETSVVGLLSAIIGIGLSGLLISLLSSTWGVVIPLPADARAAAVALAVAAVLIGWLATFLSARVAVKERVMNVLRYD
ncbi:MAG: ABC transporter permease [Chloroflexota bacterium]|nr:ABC transporter permease [Chloroflexota bacterium]